MVKDKANLAVLPNIYAFVIWLSMRLFI